MAKDCIKFRRNGRIVELHDFAPRTTLLDWIRLHERTTGTKEGCAEGDCGACAVVLARHQDDRLTYQPVNSCIFLLGQVDGAELITVEDLACDGRLHPVQAAMAMQHGSQCGFCTPGIVMSLFAHYHNGKRPPRRDDVNDALAGNLCRCTGYRTIVDAALAAYADPPSDHFVQNQKSRSEALAALDDEIDIFMGNESSFFAAPASEDTLAALYEQHPNATIVAGSTDVGLRITKRLEPIETIIHLGRVRTLNRIEETKAAWHLGAAVSLERTTQALGTIDPDIGEVLRRFGSIQVRAAGTVGGNIANGSPIGDLAPMLIALGATLELRKGSHTRSLPLQDFFLDYGKQDREPGEYIRGLTVPKLAPGMHFRAFKISKRRDEDISAVLGALCVTLQDRSITVATVAFGGMAGIPKRATSVERQLVGSSIDERNRWRDAAELVANDFTPLSDLRASAAYRLQVAKGLVFKALAEIAGIPTERLRLAGRKERPRAEG